ncbi:protein of unknown function, might related with Sensor histidine kinase [Shewanella benthica]|uniref:Solute-binding protein family 3/N-terminal domain-containing protein n=1 Tax=Shewanella benthica TaxID=43661 RepID=A0A330M659_9GAMM|nr:transporter substrate-binding domain-containing protein [Shewanella benthica]SQH75247.1 protein of unknown function, might related with Sensor histidine kinase [Shewanella benthica]
MFSTAVEAWQTDENIIFGVHSKTAPLEWRNNGVDQGFHLELMSRIGQMTGKRIVVRRKTFQQLLADVHDDTSPIDVIAVVSPVTIDRQLSQSDPIYATHAKAYTLQGKEFIHGWHDLAGKRVAIKNFVSNHKNAQLMAEINDALRQLKLSGEYDRLVNKWFGTGREKVDLSNAQQRMFWLAIFISIIWH